MDSNREEAQRAFQLAESYQTSDPQKSLKFARKACALYWSPQAAALVRTLETGEGPSTASPKKDSDKPKASSSSARPSSAAETLRARTTQSTPKPGSAPNGAQNGTAPTFKPAQAEIVKKVRRYKTTQYYEILDLKRDCDETQVKAAYRKLALALHPDKNSAPGADEAFKMVSKAFQVLSDPDKRAAFDSHGADPDSRSAGAPSASSFRQGQSPFGHDDGIDPDQLFRMFFGGGGLGGFDHPGMQFGGGPTVFQFGGGRTAYRRAGPGTWGQPMNNQRPRQQGEPEARTPAAWITFLPILLFFVVSLLQSLPALFSAPSIPDPTISWTPNSLYPIQRVTHSPVGISYFVNPTEFATHPIYEAYLKANPQLGFQPPPPSDSGDQTQALKKQLVELLPVEAGELLEMRSIERQRLSLPSAFKKFEQGIEHTWVRKLQGECHRARERRDMKRRDLMGFLGIGADWNAIRKLDAEPIPSCEGLRELGYAVE